MQISFSYFGALICFIHIFEFAHSSLIC